MSHGKKGQERRTIRKSNSSGGGWALLRAVPPVRQNWKPHRRVGVGEWKTMNRQLTKKID